jgi:hypothetical protein
MPTYSVRITDRGYALLRNETAIAYYTRMEFAEAALRCMQQAEPDSWRLPVETYAHY